MKENLRDKMIQADLKEALSNEAGRRVIGGIFNECGLWKVIFPGEGAAAAAAFQEGARAVAVGLANRIREIDPMLLAQCEIDWKAFEQRLQAMKEDRDD